MSIACTITTPEKLVYEGSADSIVVPASDGEIGILPRHAPMMALLGAGELRLKKAGVLTESIFINGGFVQVIHDNVNVLATEAELAGKIDAAAAQAEVNKLEASRHAPGLSSEDRELQNRMFRAARIKLRLSGARG